MPAGSTANASPATDTPWIAEPSGDGFYRVVNSKSVVLAQKCVKDEAVLFAAAPDLLDACVAILSQLTEDREEYQDEDVVQLREALAKAGRPLRWYRVLVRDSRLREAYVNAYDEAEARLKVEALHVELSDVPGHGAWFVARVSETPSEGR